MLPAVTVPVIVIVLVLATPLSGLGGGAGAAGDPGRELLAIDRYRRLGHGLTDQHLVVRSGSLRGRRDIVQRTGIIGWNLQQSWFQRRAGLVTLVATTAAGGQAYAAIDIPEHLAIELAHETVPGLVEPFLA